MKTKKILSSRKKNMKPINSEVDFHAYSLLAEATENKDFEGIAARLAIPSNIRLLHAAIGICTEAGELLDAVKKAIFYGKMLDKVNVEEEIGDGQWYYRILLQEFNIDLQKVLDTNIAKLRARFPNKFQEVDALVRNLDAERQILENKEMPKPRQQHIFLVCNPFSQEEKLHYLDTVQVDNQDKTVGLFVYDDEIHFGDRLIYCGAYWLRNDLSHLAKLAHDMKCEIMVLEDGV